MDQENVTVPRRVLEKLVSLAEDGQGAYDTAPYACWAVETELRPYLGPKDSCDA